MHAVKGGWVGQTFALARGNGSEGRKSRIRRSKEERKALVESFIKKYQNSNKGNFPSLNLTHKEVGGSFYTVREIVRDIIQENRVLGPAKLSPEEQSSYQFLEQDPLCSIDTEPPTMSLISNKTHLVSNHQQDTSEEQILCSDGNDFRPDNQAFENGRIINGSQVDVENRRSDGPTCVELQVSEPSEADKYLEEELAASMTETPATEEKEQVLVSNGNCTVPEHQMLDKGQTINGSLLDVKNKKSIELRCTENHEGEPSEKERNIEEKLPASEAKVNPITTDVIVEVFPLRPVTKITDSLDGILEEARELDHPLEEKEIENVECQPAPVDKEVVEDLAEPSLESSNCSTPREGIKHDSQGIRVLEAEVSCNDVGTPEMFEKSQEPTVPKAVNAPDGIHTNIQNGVYTSSSSVDANTTETILNQPKADLQRSGNSQKGIKPTLDRINLESWEGTTRRSAKPETETNPILATFKAFIAAFIKFWSE
ncbi:uncharacterized protein LOC133862371 isoform X2 [Alnus glutinosa]|uniref:uncharacterized protein LOC133862371 isoform X2 n=1 Tax=Alnus glutinosa TaxID=3517 RepID=UPI002D79A5C0|nr:uncharacterized protein LOC133862371 isoform X2 [Alnus glutinosa]